MVETAHVVAEQPMWECDDPKDNIRLVATMLRGQERRRIHRATRIVMATGGPEKIRHLSTMELCSLGMHVDEAQRMLAAIELGRRSLQLPRLGAPIQEPEDAYQCVLPVLGNLQYERFVVLLLDTKNHVRQIQTVADGGVDCCPVDVRKVFGIALRQAASAILVAHNHPSGDPSPSPEDLAVTQRLRAAGKLLGIPLLDHIIVGNPAGDRPFVSVESVAPGGK